MSTSGHRLPSAQPINRRRVLAASVASAAGLAARPATRAVAAPAGTGSWADVRLAMITDSHMNATYPERAADLAGVLAEVATEDPHAVLNCGDLTDIGSDEELALYWSCVPVGLRDRMHQVPGNHEGAWNEDLMRAYRRRFGATHYSFDLQGIHFVGLDPLVALESPRWRFGARLLDWLVQDLAAVPDGVPIICFLHFPLHIVGNDYFVSDADDFWRAVSPYDVCGILCGHIHKRQVSTANGCLQLAGNAGKNGPYYYRIVGNASAGGLDVYEVSVPTAGPVTSKQVATIPLVGPRQSFGPLEVDLRRAGTSALATVRLPAAAAVPERVQVRRYPQGYAAKSIPWSELTRQGAVWSGALDLTGWTAGDHRVEAWALDAEGAADEQSAALSLPGAVEVAWSVSLGSRTQGRLSARGSLVAVSTADDGLVMLQTQRSSGQILWRAPIGGLFRGPLIAEDGGAVIVGSADGSVRALSLGSGRPQWETMVGDPVISDLIMANLSNGPHVCGVAGHRAFCLDLHGRPVWSSDVGGSFVGEPVSDDTLVYIGSNDGSVSALDLTTGAVRWRSELVETTDPVQQIHQGAWAATLRLLPTGQLVATMDAGVAHGHVRDLRGRVGCWTRRPAPSPGGARPRTRGRATPRPP